mgnify:CR=1 FL=1
MEFIQQIDIGTIETDSSMFSLYQSSRGKPSTSDIAIFTDSDELISLTEEENLSACKALSLSLSLSLSPFCVISWPLLETDKHIVDHLFSLFLSFFLCFPSCSS